MAKPYLPKEILDYLRAQAAQGVPACSPEDIAANVSASRSTVNRHLAKMLEAKEVVRLGSGPATRYALQIAALAPSTVVTVPQPTPENLHQGFRFSEAVKPLVHVLQAPIGTRTPVTYQRSFVDDYVPNQSSLLPPSLAADLFAKGKANGQRLLARTLVRSWNNS